MQHPESDNSCIAARTGGNALARGLLCIGMDCPETRVLADLHLRLFQELAYRMAGIRIADSKRLLVQTRLAKRLRARSVADFGQYHALIMQPHEAAELQLCLNALTTNETFFFRHKPQWDYIVEQVFPRWRAAQRTPRMWSAACSTGEEPYSLAILLRESLSEREAVIDATDINDAVLRVAQAGTYGAYGVQKASPACITKYFQRLDQDRWRLVDDVRGRVRFRQANLLETGHGPAYDLVMLRNVLIYFDEPSKARALDVVGRRIAEGGWLVLGGAESLGSRCPGFTYVAPGIYQKGFDA